MAKFIPDGWVMSEKSSKVFTDLLPHLDDIIQSKIRKYNLPSTENSDLIQEARLAAAYAVDTYQSGRGSIGGYIQRVVDNALGMVASEMLAQKRQAHTHVLESVPVYEGDGTKVSIRHEMVWRRIPAKPSDVDLDMVDCGQVHCTPETELLHRVDVMERWGRERDRMRRIARLGMSRDARVVLQLKLRPPAELWVTARNMMGGRHRIDCPAIAHYLGWTKTRARAAMREIEDKVTAKIGTVMGARQHSKVVAS